LLSSKLRRHVFPNGRSASSGYFSVSSQLLAIPSRAIEFDFHDADLTFRILNYECEKRRPNLVLKPARQKFCNLLEPFSGRDLLSSFSGESICGESIGSGSRNRRDIGSAM